MTRNPRHRPLQRRSEEMVERLLTAATQVLAEVGYGQMSTNRVAAEADVSIGSLYRYFADKDELFETLRQRASDAILRRLTDAIAEAAGRPPQVGVRAVVAALVAALKEHEPVVRAL